ncbi:MAG: glycosyltransferase family 2 protein [Burkholderiaceae bacterium]|jgi:glycosyltransferase involved in cell wall biosynthesis|nr:glycosyltransferase family 2 protein [Burkholderiaceae bacterium]
MSATASGSDSSGGDSGSRWMVSVIVPCRNEAAAIDAFCASALAQALPPPWRMEVLVADGLSDDGTRAALAAWAARDARLRVIDNPRRIVSSALNAALAQARGEVIVRMDVHTQFAPDYIAQCLHALARTGADNVGGPWVARGQDAASGAIAAAFQCRWVVGGALSRDLDYEGWVDTVYLGCWPRAVFERFGGFDEQLARNQDDEHNLRMRLGGARLWQSGRIHSVYQPRDRVRNLFMQQLQYGYWRVFVMRKHGQVGAARQLVPALFVLALLLALAATPWTRWPLAALLGSYAAYLTGACVAAARAAGNWRLLPRLPLVVAAFHTGYGLGVWRGLCAALLRAGHGAGTQTLTR